MTIGTTTTYEDIKQSDISNIPTTNSNTRGDIILRDQ